MPDDRATPSSGASKFSLWERRQQLKSTAAKLTSVQTIFTRVDDVEGTKPHTRPEVGPSTNCQKVSSFAPTKVAAIRLPVMASVWTSLRPCYRRWKALAPRWQPSLSTRGMRSSGRWPGPTRKCRARAAVPVHNHTYTKFVGRPISWMATFAPPGRRVRKTIQHSGDSRNESVLYQR